MNQHDLFTPATTDNNVMAFAQREAHKAKEPDLDRRRREKARQKLLNAEIVVCDKNIVWINRELA